MVAFDSAGGAEVRFPAGQSIAPLFRFLRSTDAWGMLEVFLLALIVAAVKLVDVAEVVTGISLYAFILLIITLTTLSLTLNPDDVWDEFRVRL